MAVEMRSIQTKAKQQEHDKVDNEVSNNHPPKEASMGDGQGNKKQKNQNSSLKNPTVNL